MYYIFDFLKSLKVLPEKAIIWVSENEARNSFLIFFIAPNISILRENIEFLETTNRFFEEVIFEEVIIDKIQIGIKSFFQLADLFGFKGVAEEIVVFGKNKENILNKGEKFLRIKIASMIYAYVRVYNDGTSYLKQEVL